MKNLACKICAAFVIGLVTLLFILPGFAEEGTKSGLFTYEIKGNGTAKITGFDWEQSGADDLYIPKMIDGYTVTEIGNEAFAIENESVDYEWGKTAAVLPDTITVIGDKAFFNCIHIGTINIPASVQLIGDGAFANTMMKCSVDTSSEYFATIDGILYDKVQKKLLYCPLGLVSGNNPINVPMGIKSIGAYAFYDINKIDFFADTGNVAITLPYTVTEIGDYAFAYRVLGKFSIPNSVERIGAGAFFHSDFHSPSIGGNYNSLYIPPSVKYIGEFCFSGWKGPDPRFWGEFGNIYLQDSKIEIIPKSAFSDIHLMSNNLILGGDHPSDGWISLPKTVTIIEEGAFSNTSIRGVKMPEGLNSIGNKAFYGSSIADLQLPETLKTIGNEAFQEVANIGTIRVPNSVESIGADFCDRTQVTLQVEPGSYAAIWASENGYPATGTGGDDTSWLTD